MKLGNVGQRVSVGFEPRRARNPPDGVEFDRSRIRAVPGAMNINKNRRLLGSSLKERKML
jgi:hypothetical protein